MGEDFAATAEGTLIFQIRLNLDPFMIHETFLYLTETAFGSHPCRVVSATYRTLRPFHGGNTGSNPVGDANKIKELPFILIYGCDESHDRNLEVKLVEHCEDCSTLVFLRLLPSSP